MAIGIFDSGSGWSTVYNSIVCKMPQTLSAYYVDSPYALCDARNVYEICGLTTSFVSRLWEEGYDLAVLARNTASAGAFGRMQQSGRPNDKRVLEFIMPLIEVLTWRKWCDKSPSLEISIKKAIHCLTMCFILPCAKRRE